MEKKLLLQNGLGLPHLLPLRTSFGNLCVISPRVCRTIKWLTPIVLKGMLHGPVKGRVSLQSGTEMLEELQKRLWSLTVSSFLFGKPWSMPVHYKLYGGEKKKKKSLSVITCHQTSLCDNPSVCSPCRFVTQNQMLDSSKSLEQHMAYGIMYLNRNHSIRNTRVPTVINKR